MKEEIRRWERTFLALRSITEFILLLVILTIFRLLPIDTASALGGFIARSFGPFLPQSKGAQKRLLMAFPEKSDEDVKEIISNVWDNFGRTAAEYPHLSKFRCYGNNGRVELCGEAVLKNIESVSQSHIFFSGHFANPEIAGTAVNALSRPLIIVYRAANNPLINWLLLRVRQSAIGAKFVPKGAKGARELLAAVRQNAHIGLLVDQKMNDGISVPFFGREAMTAPALAQLALKSGRPIIPLKTERLKGAWFRVTVYPALNFDRTGDQEADIHNIMIAINKVLESWIRENPDQWLWLHNRWSD